VTQPAEDDRQPQEGRGLWPCGILGAPHGLDGRLHLRLSPDGSIYFAAGTRFYVSARGDQPLQEVELERAGGSDRRPLVRVGSARTREAAALWTGGLLLAAGGELDEWPQHVCGDLIGLRALSGGADIGTVTDVLQGVAQDILLITAVDGAEIMVPLVDELVTVDLEAGAVSIREGLL